MARIGVFDSGRGGRSVANAIERALPEHEVIFKNDPEHMPYGTKSKAELRKLVVPILQTMVDAGCDAIVIACNTVTTTLINELRMQFMVPLIGMEPMVKPAAEQTKTGVIAVCATPATLASQRYKYLKEEYAQGITVLEPDCSDWAAMIEANNLNREKIANIIDDTCVAGADVIVLGCTHYHWIESIINQEAKGRAQVIQPEQPVIKQLQRILSSV